MARIWYSVLGDGMGHAVRSHSVLQHLIGKHDIRITAADKAYPFMKRHYPDITTEIKGTAFVYGNNEVVMGRTLKKYIGDLPGNIRDNYRVISKFLLRFRPQMVISDFESSSHYFAWLLKIPCISIDNVHILTECRVKLPRKKSFGKGTTRAFIKFLHPKSDYYIITAFADAKPKSKKVIMVPPVIRQEVLRLKPVDKGHILIYQTSPTNNRMIPVLNKSGQRYKVYGMGKRKSVGKIEFKEFSENDFLEDLRTCRYAIVNGGFTVISEALYLKKPILAVPIVNQGEQEFNAYSLYDKGYGNFTRKLTLADLQFFEQNINVYRRNLKKLKTWNNNQLYKAVDELIRKIEKKGRKPKYELIEKW